MSHSEAKEKKWTRPFEALIKMTPEQRENIRDTLNFDWAKETVTASESDRPVRESWEIIDCDVRGVAARLHTILEQVNPVKYISWRRALMRALDGLDSSYAADDSEESLEKKFIKTFERDGRYSARAQSSMPGASLAKLDKHGKIASEVISTISEGWDDILGSEDWPAVTCMYSICRTLHRTQSEF